MFINQPHQVQTGPDSGPAAAFSSSYHFLSALNNFLTVTSEVTCYTPTSRLPLTSFPTRQAVAPRWACSRNVSRTFAALQTIYRSHLPLEEQNRTSDTSSRSGPALIPAPFCRVSMLSRCMLGTLQVLQLQAV